jgi:hypothetical protein
MHEQTAVVRLPLEGPIFALVEDWRRSQPKIPSRNEAIRLLLQRALERSSENSEAAVGEREGAAESARCDLPSARKRRGPSMTGDNSKSAHKKMPRQNRGKLKVKRNARRTYLRA